MKLRSAPTVVFLITILATAVSSHASTSLWIGTGQALCIASGDQQNISMIPDGSGGAILVWNSGGDVYAGRVDADGNRLWGLGGVPLRTAEGACSEIAIVSDGAGGVIAVWEDGRASASQPKIYAQRVDRSGTVAWSPADGVAVCDLPGRMLRPTVVSDGGGGAIFAWQDSRATSPYDYIYAQRVSAGGAPQWTANGRLVGDVVTFGQWVPMGIEDGAGGAILVYGTSSNADTRAVRIDSDGDHVWSSEGVVVKTQYNGSNYRRIASDGAGGFFLVIGNTNITAQRVDTNGNVLWSPMVDICTATGQRINARLIADGFGGAVIAWEDKRNGTTDLFAQRINATGATQWTTDGVAIVTRPNNQQAVSLSPDGTGGAHFAWRDDRASAGTYKAFAQRIDGIGDVQWADDGVSVSPLGNSLMYPRAVSDGAGGVIVAWESHRSSSLDIYGQRLTDIAVSARGPAASPQLVLRANVPNPFNATTAITFSSPDAAPARLSVYDVRGRLVDEREFTADQGWQTFDLDATTLRSGVYFYRLRVDGHTATQKFVVMR